TKSSSRWRGSTPGFRFDSDRAGSMGSRLAVTGVIGELLKDELGDLDLSMVNGVVLLRPEPAFSRPR
ncbi:MAG: hypothetical protein M3P18_02005, partial [Actinomycetota bacterium]|nr:hypothetical protein [Actinomycetota bacterium]